MCWSTELLENGVLSRSCEAWKYIMYLHVSVLFSIHVAVFKKTRTDNFFSIHRTLNHNLWTLHEHLISFKGTFVTFVSPNSDIFLIDITVETEYASFGKHYPRKILLVSYWVNLTMCSGMQPFFPVCCEKGV